MSIIKQLLGAHILRENTRQPSLDRLLESFDRELENFSQLVEPSPESKPRTPFNSEDLNFEDMYMSRLSFRQLLSVLPVMIPLQLQMRHSAQMYQGDVQPKISQAAPVLIDRLEAAAYRTGAADIKYVKVPRRSIFKHKGIPYSNAVVITVEMDREKMAGAPSFEAFREVARGYKDLAVIGNRLANVLREAGAAAYPGTALGGITDYTHLAEVAGLGAIGYHGLLISPGEGARLRINTNLTNLPVETENDHLWVRDFCALCQKCIRSCPVEAIFDRPQPRGDGGYQTIDHDACRDYFNQEYGCAVCLAACPFSQVGYQAVRERFRGNPEAPRFRIPEGI